MIRINLPARWRLTTLGEIARAKPNNGIFRKNPEYLTNGSGGIPVVWVEQLFRGNSIDTSSSRRVAPTKAEVEKYGLKKGDVLFCRSSLKLDGIAFNNVYLGEDNAALFECHIIRISPKLADVSPLFLNWLLRSPHVRAVARSKSKTATMTTIDQQRLASIPIVLPPLAEQRRIADVLNRAGDLRAQRRVTLDQLDSLTRSLFLDRFGDPYGNPKKWPQVRLDSICRLVNGRAFKPEDWETEGLPIVRIQNLNNPTKPFNYTTKPINERFRVRPGDILFSWSGTPGTSFGCFRWRGREGCLNQHIFNVRLNEKIDGEFFISQLNLKLGELIRKAHGGVGLQHVTKGMVDETMLMLPPLALQREFSGRVRAVEKLKNAQRKSLAEFDALFTTLEHRAFNGELFSEKECKSLVA